MPVATGPTISCGLGSVPVAVIATYAGGIVPVQGANVTVYVGAVLPGLRMDTVPAGFTDNSGLAQVCISAFRYNEAWIQKGGVDFGSGVGQRHKIAGNAGGAGRFTYYIQARTPPGCPLPQVFNPLTGKCEAPPCTGELSAPTLNFASILSGPTMPSTIPFQITSTVGGALQNIPIAIIVDGNQVTTTSTNRSFDILGVIRSLGPTAVSTGHTVTIKSLQPNCNIPPLTFNIPALVPAIPTCTPPKVLNPLTRQCETPTIPCTPPAVLNPVTGKCETPPAPPLVAPPAPPPPPSIPSAPILPGKSVHIETLQVAYPTQKLPIIVTVLCGSKPSNGEYATLYIDGEAVDEKPTSNGLVQFTWTAEAGTHRAIVDVPASDFCNRPGRDAVDINVSSVKPSILEQLTRERQAYQEQQAALEQQRRLIRELPLPAAVPISTLPELTPALTSVSIPPISAPAGTTVSIGGRVIPAPTTAPVTVQVPPGSYTVIVQPPGGSPVSKPIQIPSSPVPVPITLPALPALPGV